MQSNGRVLWLAAIGSAVALTPLLPGAAETYTGRQPGRPSFVDHRKLEGIEPPRRLVLAQSTSPSAEQLEDAMRLVRRGRQLAANGDILGARMFFERAATDGSPDGASELAGTYDASHLRAIGAVGVAADADLAQRWRRRADDLKRAADAAASSRRATAAAPVSPAAFAPVSASAPAASAPTTVSVPVAAAPTPSTPAAAPADSEAQRFVARGRKLIEIGDIEAARLFFERAAGSGSAEAAIELGATFDPEHMSRLHVVGIAPDRARAAGWYRRARDLGSPAAAERLRRLEP